MFAAYQNLCYFALLLFGTVGDEPTDILRFGAQLKIDQKP